MCLQCSRTMSMMSAWYDQLAPLLLRRSLVVPATLFAVRCSTTYAQLPEVISANFVPVR